MYTAVYTAGLTSLLAFVRPKVGSSCKPSTYQPSDSPARGQKLTGHEKRHYQG